METLTCKNCGGAAFEKKGEEYICQHCGSIIVPKVRMPHRRLMMIMALLVVVIGGIFALYRTLYSVKKDIEALSNETHLSENAVQKHASDTETADDPYREIEASLRKRVTKSLHYSPLEKVMRAYHRMPNHKAFFIALNRDGVYAYGYAEGQGTVKDAATSAFESCEKERKKRQMNEMCIPYLVDDHVAGNLAQ